MSHFKLGALLAALALSVCLPAQEKEIRKSFSGVKNLDMEVRYGDLVVTSSADGKVNLRTIVRVKGHNEEDEKQVLEQFNMKMTQSGSRLSIRQDFQIKNWETRNGNTTLTLQDGRRIKNLDNFEVEYFLSVPELDELKVANRYKDIEITQNLESDLVVNLYNGKLIAQDIRGRLTLEGKYSEARVRSTQGAELDIFDGKLDMGDCGEVSLVSKYSEIELGNCASLTLNTYDDDIKTRTISGQLNVEDKYSDLDFGDFDQAELNLYDSDFKIGSGRDIRLSSKYSDLKTGIIRNLVFEESYDDDFSATEVEAIQLTSKYSSIDIGRVLKKLKIESYSDEIEVDQFNGEVESIGFNGKYTKLDLNLNSSLEYRLQANMTYGNLKFDESSYQMEFYKDKNDRIELRARTKGATDGSPLIELSGYDCKIRL